MAYPVRSPEHITGEDVASGETNVVFLERSQGPLLAQLSCAFVGRG